MKENIFKTEEKFVGTISKIVSINYNERTIEVEECQRNDGAVIRFVTMGFSKDYQIDEFVMITYIFGIIPKINKLKDFKNVLSEKAVKFYFDKHNTEDNDDGVSLGYKPSGKYIAESRTHSGVDFADIGLDQRFYVMPDLEYIDNVLFFRATFTDYENSPKNKQHIIEFLFEVCDFESKNRKITFRFWKVEFNGNAHKSEYFQFFVKNYLELFKLWIEERIIKDIYCIRTLVPLNRKSLEFKTKNEPKLILTNKS